MGLEQLSVGSPLGQILPLRPEGAQVGGRRDLLHPEAGRQGHARSSQASFQNRKQVRWHPE